MDFTLNFHVHMMRLQFDPVMNRRTLYASITIGKRVYWLQRWDTDRCMPAYEKKPKPFAFSRDKLMCWTCGAR